MGVRDREDPHPIELSDRQWSDQKLGVERPEPLITVMDLGWRSAVKAR
jgi:hypothetical protein